VLDVEHELTELLDVHALRQRGGVHHVAEEHGELAPLTLGRGPLLGLEPPPQSPQKLASSEAGEPQAGQVRGRGAPQPSQKRPGPVSRPQLAHVAPIRMT
jgi:hypothetical protein